MRITKSRLKRIIKEELQNEMFGFSKKIELTPEEQQIISQDQDIINLVNQLRQEMEDLADNNQGKPGKAFIQTIWNVIKPNSTGKQLQKLVQQKVKEIRKNGSNRSTREEDDGGFYI